MVVWEPPYHTTLMHALKFTACTHVGRSWIGQQFEIQKSYTCLCIINKQESNTCTVVHVCKKSVILHNSSLPYVWKYGSLLFLRKFYASGPCMVFCCRTISAKLYILYYINYTTCTLKMYFRISETYLLFIGFVIIMIIEMRVQLKNLKHDQITLLHSNPLSFFVYMYIFYVSPLHFPHVISLLKHEFLSIQQLNTCLSIYMCTLNLAI